MDPMLKLNIDWRPFTEFFAATVPYPGAETDVSWRPPDCADGE
jgi:hypothetical protein